MGQKASHSTYIDSKCKKDVDIDDTTKVPLHDKRGHGVDLKDVFASVFRTTCTSDRKRCPGKKRKALKRLLRCAGILYQESSGDRCASSGSLAENPKRRERYLRRLGIDRGKATPRVSSKAKEKSTELLVEDPTDINEIDITTHTKTRRSSGSMRSVSEDLSGSQVISDSGMRMPLIASDLAMAGMPQQDQSRMKFLRRLSYEGVWLPRPQRPPSHQTLIIFDWDDTLLCTSFLRSLELSDEGLVVSPRIMQQLQACELASAKLLQLALSLGQTFIITNAIENWVEASAECWAPSLVPLLQKVRIVSARSKYEEEYPRLPGKWKAETFLEVRRKLDSQVITNIISLGDSEYEMDATQAMGKEFEQASIKLIKFTESPCPEELLKQLELVIEEFERIVGKAQNVRVRLQRPARRTESGGSGCNGEL